MSLHLIVNPHSGRGRTGKRLSGILKKLERAGLAFSYHVTERSGQAEEWARKLSAEGAPLIAAVGGDGTVNEVVNGLFGKETALAVIPGGTGNDFARTLQVETEESAIRAIAQGRKRRIDVGRVGERLFVNVAGTGFDAEVARSVNRDRFLSGTPAYIWAVIKNLFAFRAGRITLDLDGKTVEEKAMLVAVANARSYGGGMKIAPDALLDDGLFDICLVKEVGRGEFLKTFPRVFAGTHASHPGVCIYRAGEVQIESEFLWPVLADGEIICQTPARFSILPKALEVIVPG